MFDKTGTAPSLKAAALTLASKEGFERLSVPGFYVDRDCRLYFAIREFVRCSGLPDNPYVRSAVIRGVLEMCGPSRICLVSE